jgi:hypothetical protein
MIAEGNFHNPLRRKGQAVLKKTRMRKQAAQTTEK